MAFDKTKPVYKSKLVSQQMRDNFNALATDHAGPEAPTDPEPGYTWLDTSEGSNVKIKRFNGTSWVVEFEHVESDPVAAGAFGPTGDTGDQGLTGGDGPTGPTGDGGGGGGGTFTRGVATGSHDQLGQYVPDQFDISGFPNNAIITRLLLWPTPIGGGQFPSEQTASFVWAILPKPATTTTNDGSAIPLFTRTYGITVRKLKVNAAQGTTQVDFTNNVGVLLGEALALYDGSIVEFHTVYKTEGGIVQGYYRDLFLEPIARVGGFTTAHYGIPAAVSQLSHTDILDGTDLHVLTINTITVQFRINYRIEYLYLA